MLRASCVLPEPKAAESSSAVHYTTSALSPVNRLKWLEQVQDDERLGMVAVAVASALARFHNSATGLTCPSQETIAGKAHAKERAVRDAIRELVETGHLVVCRRGRTSSSYMLVLKPAPYAGQERASVTVLSCPPPDERHDQGQERHVALPQPAPHAAKQEKEQNITDRPVETTEPADLDVERLARRIQQTSGTPWRLENARREVIDAFHRVGLQPIRALADQIAGVGLPAWEVRRRLEGLDARSPGMAPSAKPSINRPSEDLQAGPRPADVLGDHPAVQSNEIESANQKQAAGPSELIRVAIRLMGQGDCATRLRWYRRSLAAGVTVAMFDEPKWVPLIAREFLATEHPSALENIEQ